MEKSLKIGAHQPKLWIYLFVVYWVTTLYYQTVGLFLTNILRLFVNAESWNSRFTAKLNENVHASTVHTQSQSFRRHAYVRTELGGIDNIITVPCLSHILERTLKRFFLRATRNIILSIATAMATWFWRRCAIDIMNIHDVYEMFLFAVCLLPCVPWRRRTTSLSSLPPAAAAARTWRNGDVMSRGVDDVIVTSSSSGPEMPSDVTDDAAVLRVQDEVENEVEREIQLFTHTNDINPSASSVSVTLAVRHHVTCMSAMLRAQL